ncbi:hypothetical protein [Hyalangium versicolor]|uniref:hypothetical protein n=1 Tax=Hyalangium versicolor TaxID=2861190 RepID=UPI001CCF06A8|nr:hypothetical protein [Hyalangium versicolor]
MRLKKWLVGSLLGAVALLGSGCSNTCDAATERIDKRYSECGIALGDSDEAPQECSDEDASELEHEADCIEKASCDDVKSGLYLTKC